MSLDHHLSQRNSLAEEEESSQGETLRKIFQQPHRKNQKLRLWRDREERTKRKSANKIEIQMKKRSDSMSSVSSQSKRKKVIKASEKFSTKSHPWTIREREELPKQEKRQKRRPQSTQ